MPQFKELSQLAPQSLGPTRKTFVFVTADLVIGVSYADLNLCQTQVKIRNQSCTRKV